MNQVLWRSRSGCNIVLNENAFHSLKDLLDNKIIGDPFDKKDSFRHLLRSMRTQMGHVAEISMSV